MFGRLSTIWSCSSKSSRGYMRTKLSCIGREWRSLSSVATFNANCSCSSVMVWWLLKSLLITLLVIGRSFDCFCSFVNVRYFLEKLCRLFRACGLKDISNALVEFPMIMSFTSFLSFKYSRVCTNFEVRSPDRFFTSIKGMVILPCPSWSDESMV